MREEQPKIVKEERSRKRYIEEKLGKARLTLGSQLVTQESRGI